MIAFHKDKYWHVRPDEDRRWVYIWRYQPEDGCPERVDADGHTVYEKRLRIQGVDLMDIEFYVMTNYMVFEAKPDDTQVIISTRLPNIARQYKLITVYDEHGKEDHWQGYRTFGECQEYYVIMYKYAARYVTHGDETAVTKEQRQLTKEEWVELYRQSHDALIPPQ